MLTRMYLYSTSTKLSIDVWLYLDRPGSLKMLDSVKYNICRKQFIVFSNFKYYLHVGYFR